MPSGNPVLVDRASKHQRASKYRAVFSGRGWRFKDQHPSILYYKTSGTRGLGAHELMLSKTGRVVSKKRHAAGRRQYNSNMAIMKANQFN